MNLSEQLRGPNKLNDIEQLTFTMENISTTESIASQYLLSLPRELRDKIHRFILKETDSKIRPCQRRLTRAVRKSRHNNTIERPYLIDISILSTNKQIHSEASYIFYTENFFAVIAPVHGVRYATLRQMKKLSVEIDCIGNKKTLRQMVQFLNSHPGLHNLHIKLRVS